MVAGRFCPSPGGERAGKRIRFEKEDMDLVRQEATLVRDVSLETVCWLAISYGDRLSNTAIRGVYPEYGPIRNEIPSEGRWIGCEDFLERRGVVFLGGTLRKQLSGGRPAVGETVLIQGLRFTVIGTMDPKPRTRCGREEFRPIIDGITIGLQVLLVFIGALTLGIGGMGAQSLAEALVLALAVAVGSLPLLRPAFKDTSGKGDIHLANSLATVAVSTGILVLVGAPRGAIVSEWTIHSRCATSGVRQRR